jgi:hypothetical protein
LKIAHIDGLDYCILKKFQKESENDIYGVKIKKLLV